MRLLAAAVLSLSTACFTDPGLPGAADAGASTTDGEGATETTGSTTTGAVTTTAVVTMTGATSQTTESIPGCLYSSDFAGEPVAWSEVTPTWTWDPGVYVGEYTTSDVASRTATMYTGAVPADVVVTARVNLKEGGRAGVLLRASPTLGGDYLAIELDGIEGRLAVYVTDSQQVGIGTNIAAGTWVTLRAELTNGALKIGIDENTPASGLQFAGSFGDGVGLFVAEGAAEFDDVTICAAGG